MKCSGGENERKFLEIQSERVKNYLWERGIQLSDGGKGKKKAELFDLCKKAAAMKQVQQATFAEDGKNWRKTNCKQVWANLWFLKFWILGCTTSVAFQNSR